RRAVNCRPVGHGGRKETTGMAEYITIESQALTRAIAAIVSAGGSSAEEAQQVAESLVGANLTGHDSHGVGMIPRYVESRLEGGLLVDRQPSVKMDSGVLLALDG